MKKSTNRQQLFKIILTAILIALNVILERFLAYSVWNQTISFGFIAVAFAAAFLGTPYAVAVAGFGDLIGSLLFPFGAYFPGFTLTNCIYGLILAEFIYKNSTPIKIIISVVLNKIVCSLILNTLWISIMYRGGVDAFFAVLITRLLSTGILAAVELIVLLLMFSEKSKIRILLEKNLKKII
ncbi:MAG: folate family ECF transporter S component [Clostridia bacterium]|nr:folate family ECF transporter S component [Clostridia bacterium]